MRQLSHERLDVYQKAVEFLQRRASALFVPQLCQRKQFASSSQQTKGMRSLFDEAESEAPPEPSKRQKVSYERNRPKRQPLPASLPRVETVYDPSRGAATARALLDGYRGSLLVDGYEAYEHGSMVL